MNLVTRKKNSVLFSVDRSFFYLGFEIPDADYDKLYTVQNVVDYLVKKTHATDNSKPVVSSASDPRYDEHHH